jgi:hypothetical protein
VRDQVSHPYSTTGKITVFIYPRWIPLIRSSVRYRWSTETGIHPSGIAVTMHQWLYSDRVDPQLNLRPQDHLLVPVTARIARRMQMNHPDWQSANSNGNKDSRSSWVTSTDWL